MHLQNHPFLSRLPLCGFALGFALLANPAFAQKMLDGDEVKKLIAGKTVHITHAKSGKQWRSYFAEDGKAFLDNSGQEESWEIDDKGRHCNTGVPLMCAKIRDNGDGTYSRMKPNGEAAVTWTKIEDGKKF